jgi:hypothetical protein
MKVELCVITEPSKSFWDAIMLREDRNIRMVRLSLTLPRMFTGRWTLQSGRKVGRARWTDTQVDGWRSRQQQDPVCLNWEGRRFGGSATASTGTTTSTRPTTSRRLCSSAPGVLT